MPFLLQVVYVSADGSLSTAQLYITNYNTEDLLAPTSLQKFLNTLETVLGSSEPWIVSVNDPTSIGVLSPPPPNKHGYEMCSNYSYDLRSSSSNHKLDFVL